MGQNITIITHVDGDGLCAAALTIQGLQKQNVSKNNIKTIFTQPYMLFDLVSDLSNKETAPDDIIYILDLAGKKQIIPILQKFTKILSYLH